LGSFGGSLAFCMPGRTAQKQQILHFHRLGYTVASQKPLSQPAWELCVDAAASVMIGLI
jgi:hypothetical protein